MTCRSAERVETYAPHTRRQVSRERPRPTMALIQKNCTKTCYSSGAKRGWGPRLVKLPSWRMMKRAWMYLIANHRAKTAVDRFSAFTSSNSAISLS